MTKWVDSNATGGTDTGDSWTNAYLTIQQALTAASAGEEIWVAAGGTPHNETLAAGNVTLTCANGTDASPVVVLSIDPADDSYNPVSVAQITTNTPATDDLDLSGWFNLCGIALKCDLLSPFVTSYMRMVCIDCLIEVDTYITADRTRCSLELRGCTITNTSATMSQGTIWLYYCDLLVDNCTFTTPIDTTPPGLITATTSHCTITVKNSDFSAYTSFVSGVIRVVTEDTACKYLFINNKMAAGEPLLNVSAMSAGSELVAYNTGSGNTLTDYYYLNYYGEVLDSTSIYLTGSDGVTNYSFLMDPSGNGLKEQVQPLRFMLGSVQLDASASETVKVNITYDNATALQDDELWIEVEYADDTTNQGLIATTAPGIGVTPSNLTTNSESWTGTSGFTNGVTAHCITSAISDGKACMARVYVCLAKDQTVYVCPEVVVD